MYRKCVTWPQKPWDIGVFYSNLNSVSTNHTIIREVSAVGRVRVQEDGLTWDSGDPFTPLDLTLSATTYLTSFILHCALGSTCIQLTVWFEHLNLDFKPFYSLTSGIVCLWVYPENKITNSYFLTGLLPWICKPEHQHFQGPNMEFKVNRGYSDSYSRARGRTVVKCQSLQDSLCKTN
jgi:hypothetical protein